MRQSRLSRFNAVKDELDAKGDAFVEEYIAEHLAGETPTKFYEISVNHVTHPGVGYHIAELPVVNIGYHWKLPWFDKRPSEDNIDAARKLLDEPLDPKWIMVNTEFAKSYGKSSWSHSIALFDNPEPGMASVSFVPGALDEDLARLIDVFVPKAGQFKCRYCGKATDEGKKVRGVIIARQYPNMRAEFDYCSGQCATHDQMAHEG